MSGAAQHKTILVADDQDFIRSLLVRMLKDLGFKTLEASDGAQAMDRLGAQPDILILDQQMEKLTGLEILRSIRSGQTPLTHDVPVLILTGHADVGIVQVAAELDVSALLSKPVSKVQLQERLATADRHRPAAKPLHQYAEVKVPSREVAPAAPRLQGRAWVVKPSSGEIAPPFVTAGDQKRQASAQEVPKASDVHYSRVRPGMILGKSLYSETGKLLLSAGTELTADTVKRLVRRCEVDPDLEFLAIVPTKSLDHRKS